MTEPGNEQALQWSRPSVMSLTIKDRAGLYAAYMPFLQRGGIFVPGDETRYPVAGKVAWITPAGSTHTAGIGVQFPDDESGARIRRRIEELLGTALGASRPTHTI